MKNVYLYLTLLLLTGINGFAQGADVIIWLDNSASMDDTEFGDATTSVKSVIHNILLCNDNRVAVVHYAAGVFNTGIMTPKIYIETDFTGNETIANSFVRRSSNVGTSDYAHESLNLIGNALDHIANSNITSPQTVLNHIPTRPLIIYLFTDAYRDYFDSYLVNVNAPAQGTNQAFENYTSFKTYRNAKFVVSTIYQPVYNQPNNTDALKAAAAIASGGGNYTGAVESYPADPYGPGVTGRYLTNNNYLLTAGEIETVSGYICTLSAICPQVLVLTSPINDVVSGTDNRQVANKITASNIINPNTEANYFAGNVIELNDGFYAAGGSLFLAKINSCTNGGGGVISARQANQTEESEIIEKQNGYLIVAPNPATDVITINSADNIKSITITSLDGKVMFNKSIAEASASYSIDVSGYKQGLYITTITTDSGITKNIKLIKK